MPFDVAGSTLTTPSPGEDAGSGYDAGEADVRCQSWWQVGRRQAAGWGAPTFACGADWGANNESRGSAAMQHRMRSATTISTKRAHEGSVQVVGLRRRRRMMGALRAAAGLGPAAAKDGRHPRLVFFGCVRQSQASSRFGPGRSPHCHWPGPTKETISDLNRQWDRRET